ncbi:type IV secretory system conjugative DNA transfer family protein [Caballeronia sp. AZ7_KS35]|uniref:type IV secretory system conjugative DNA transfer family protein n=1 Tax=Caballeronia sp. AZ7_KS35 TaxID=2921762 RepID=UPI00202837DB|nr:type IV secretory system conjugative DNA transfer family protein [Caballeronia sp. AZ7_KS35]
MGEMFSNVIRYAIWALAVFLAFHFGRAVGFKLLSPWLTRDPTFLFVGGALILGGSVGWTGDRLGALAARGYKPGYFFTGRAIAGWLLLAFAFVVAFFAGPYLGRFLRPYTAPLIGRDRYLEWIVGGLAIAALIVGFGRGWGYFFGRDAAGKTDQLTRRAVGYFWRFWAGLIAIGLPIAVYAILLNLPPVISFGRYLHTLNLPESIEMSFYWALEIPFFVAAILMFAGGSLNYMTMIKTAIGKGSRPIRRMARAYRLGAGGSANFGSVLEEWANPWSPGKILLGASLYDPKWLVGVADDRHALTVAGSGGGKGRAVIVPNLLTWPHSALVIDPKGTNAAVTGAYRGNGGGKVKGGMRQAVYCLNPFNVNAGVAGMPPPSRFNPLSMVDVNGPTAFEDLDLIADALVVPGKADPHWTNSARSVIRGVTAYALSVNPGATLGDVRDMITHPDGLPIDGMVAAGGVAKESASQLIAASDRELGGDRFDDDPANRLALGFLRIKERPGGIRF